METTNTTSQTTEEVGQVIDEAQGDYPPNSVPADLLSVLDSVDAAFTKKHRWVRETLDHHMDAADRVVLQQSALLELEKRRIENIKELITLRDQLNGQDT